MNEKEISQTLSLEDRKILTLTGIVEVETSDEKQVLIKTNMGRLKITGTGLSIGSLSTEDGHFSLSGNINSLEYKEARGGGKISSLFK